MMGHRDKLKDADEFDVVYDRQAYKFTKRSGVCRRVKKKINRRARKEAKDNLRKGKK